MSIDQIPLNNLIERYWDNGMFEFALHYSKEYVFKFFIISNFKIALFSDLEGWCRHFKLLYLCQRYQEIIELFKTYFCTEISHSLDVAISASLWKLLL